MAWLENNLLADLRIPFTGSKRWSLSKHGSFYRAGMIHPCPFTGFYFDDDLLESIQTSIRKGDTLKEAFENLADVTRKAIEDETEGQSTEETFLETSEANEWHYTIEGRRA
jgi:hypothetical protein